MGELWTEILSSHNAQKSNNQKKHIVKEFSQHFILITRQSELVVMG